MLAAGQGSQGFDRLRKDYPERRELAGARLVKSAGALPDRWVTALGAIVDGAPS